MAQPRRKAKFFVSQNGTVYIKAKPLSANDRWRIFIRDAGICQLCGTRVDFGYHSSPFDNVSSVSVDHILPRSRGGQNDESNLRLICHTCNCGRGSKTDEEWLGGDL